MKKLLTVILMSAMLCGVAEVEAQSYHKKGFGVGIVGVAGCSKSVHDGQQKLNNYRDPYVNVLATLGYHINENYYVGLQTNLIESFYIVARYDMNQYAVNPYFQIGGGSLVGSVSYEDWDLYGATASAGVSWRRFTLGLMFDYRVIKTVINDPKTMNFIRRERVNAVTLGYFF